jgi:hypothetical protein
MAQVEKDADEKYKAKAEAIEKERKAKIAAIEEAADKTGFSSKLKDIWGQALPPLDTKKFEDSMKGIGLTPEQKKTMEDAAKELADVIKERDKLVGEAKTKAKSKVLGDFDVPDFKKNPLQLGLENMMGQFKAAGSFNPNAAWGMGGGGLAQQVVKNTGATAEQVRQLNNKVKGNASFAGDNPEATFA